MGEDSAPPNVQTAEFHPSDGPGGPSFQTAEVKEEPGKPKTAPEITKVSGNIQASVPQESRKATPEPKSPEKPKASNRPSGLDGDTAGALRPKTEGQWKGAASTLIDPKPSITTKGPIRVDIVNNSLGVDGMHYNAYWEPLDENGEVAPQVMNPGSGKDVHGGVAAPLGRTTQILEPPFENRNGWRVTIEVPLQDAANGNSAGPYLDIFQSRPK
jgi:hypothetical protein